MKPQRISKKSTDCSLQTAVSPRRRQAAGFTLLELLTVMLIMFILMGMSTLALRGVMRGAGIRGAISVTRGVLTQARQQAMMNQMPVGVVFSQDQDTSSMQLVVSFGTVARLLQNPSQFEVENPIPWTGDDLANSAIFNLDGQAGTVVRTYVNQFGETNELGYVTSGISWNAGDGVGFPLGTVQNLPPGVAFKRSGQLSWPWSGTDPDVAVLVFQPDGSAEGMLTFDLVEKTVAQGGYSVEVDEITGRITVEIIE